MASLFFFILPFYEESIHSNHVRDVVSGDIFGGYYERTPFLKGDKEKLQVNWKSYGLHVDFFG